MTTGRRTRARVLGAGIGAVAVVTLTACSSAGSSTSAAAPPASAVAASTAATAAESTPTSGAATGHANPCSLLSVQQASALTHQTFTAAEPSSLGRSESCAYPPGGDTTETLVVGISYSALCWGGEQGIGDGTAQKVTGVGDGAIGYAAGLAVKDGSDVCVDVSGDSRAESAGDWSADIAVANAIMARLR